MATNFKSKMRHIFFIIFGCGFLLMCRNINLKTISDKTDDIVNKNLHLELDSIGILDYKITDDTLDIISDGKLTWQTFKTPTLEVDSLQLLYNSIFKVIKKYDVTEFTYGNSLLRIKKVEVPNNAEELAEFHNSKLEKEQLQYALIVDSEIELLGGIKIGITKKDFFEKHFFELQIPFEQINVVRNFDPPGETIEQFFYFENNKLKKIVMKTPY